MTFRDTRHQQLVARPAPIADPANASDRVRLGRAFATALDALVRAQQLHLTAAEALVARATEAAKAVTEQSLHFEASGITLDGEMVLAATPDSGAWVLQAWYAGLRGLTASADVRSDDVRLLAGGLGQAAPGAAAVDALASWLWSSPVDGFRLDLRACAVERIEAVTGDANAGRAALRLGWLDAAARALQDVDPRAPRSTETQQRERAWWPRATSGDLALTETELLALRAEADDPAAQLRMDLMAALAEQGWQQAIAPPLVARLLTRVAARTFDTDLNALSGLLSADEANYGRVCVAELAHFPVGEALAKAAPLGPAMTADEVARVQALVNRVAESTAIGFVQGLLGRLAEQPEALLPVFGQIAHALSFEAFLRLASPATLPPAIRPLVGRVLLAAAPSAEEWVTLCASLPVSAFLEVLRATPLDALEPLIPALGPAVAKADARERTQMVLWLTDPARAAQVPPAAIAALTEGFVASGGNGWELRTIRLVADAALRVGYAADALLEMMRNAKVPAETRLQVLEALVRSPSHATEALKWRMGEMFDAPELRDRLVELRKRRQP